MLSYKKYLLLLFFFHFNCTIFIKDEILLEENYLSGKIIYFSELDEQYKRDNSFNRSWTKLYSKRFKPYYRFQNKEYVVKGYYSYMNESYIVIENRKGNQYKKKVKSIMDSIVTLPSYIYLKETKDQAEKLIGKSIWLNYTNDKTNFYTLSNYDFKRFEKVNVLGIIDFQNDKNDYPLWLKVKSETGEVGYVRFNGEQGKTGYKDHYYIMNPLPKEWGNRLIKTIVQGKIELGMTKKQVRITIGNPNKINTTSSRHGISEQWIYRNINGKNIFYQFDYEKLTYVSK
tara:strand:- start:610 stop:1467 length:858 start_codon:yes stop_codon:yes gene_type:complete